MKRSPLKRSYTLRGERGGRGLTRKTRLSSRRSKPRRVTVIRDRAYLDAVKGLGYCCVARTIPNAGPCWGCIDPMHVGKRNGMSSKGSDHIVAPGCRGHHGMHDGRRGCFEGWSEERRLRWGLEVAADARLRLGNKRLAFGEDFDW